jgi:hypothetical protein
MMNEYACKPPGNPIPFPSSRGICEQAVSARIVNACRNIPSRDAQPIPFRDAASKNESLLDNEQKTEKVDQPNARNAKQ